jgi:SAM-dependent methyltransferase
MGTAMSSDAVIWHDLECGAYDADLPHWHALARRYPGVVLDVGAGTGRVALPLARAGHDVIALERDGELAEELARRAQGLAVEVLCADACAFKLAEPVALAIVPMQTIHLFEERSAFLACARRALAPGGLLAVALLGEGAEPFELELEPDTIELGPVRYESTPTALRRRAGAVLLERRRSRISGAGAETAVDLVRLAKCDPQTLCAEAAAAGFDALDPRVIEPTREHAGSEIVCLGVPA